ncbi:hypothetical protein CSUI_000043 [Cystoisospora suis]|uniref:Uncharacterized protein n=1 Tax=Cystoisospora suis TaxID=483139 RepID=A0A2C6LIG4_9APIC|nr:hypothetical protein CSUI_000043 [Cystoisospora suis]
MDARECSLLPGKNNGDQNALPSEGMERDWCYDPSDAKIPLKPSGSKEEMQRRTEGIEQPGNLTNTGGACARCLRLERGLYLQQVRLACVAKESKELLKCVARELRTERERTRQAEASLREKTTIIQQLKESAGAAEEKFNEREREITARLDKREAEIERKEQDLKRREEEDDNVRQRLKQMENDISFLRLELIRNSLGRESCRAKVLRNSQDRGHCTTGTDSEGQAPFAGPTAQRAEQTDSGSTVSILRDPPTSDSPLALERVVVRLDRLERLFLEEKQLRQHPNTEEAVGTENESGARTKEKVSAHECSGVWEVKDNSASESCTLSVNKVASSQESSPTLLSECAGHSRPLHGDSGGEATANVEIMEGKEGHKKDLGPARHCSCSTGDCNLGTGVSQQQSALASQLVGGPIQLGNGELQVQLQEVPETVSLQLLHNDQRLTEPHGSAAFIVACFRESMGPHWERESPGGRPVPLDEPCQLPVASSDTEVQRSQASALQLSHTGQRWPWALTAGAHGSSTLLHHHYREEPFGVRACSDMVNRKKGHLGANDEGVARSPTRLWHTPRSVCSLLSQATVARGAFTCIPPAKSPAVFACGCEPPTLPDFTSQSTCSLPSMSITQPPGDSDPWVPEASVGGGRDRGNKLEDLESRVLRNTHSLEPEIDEVSQEIRAPELERNVQHGLSLSSVPWQAGVFQSRWQSRAGRIPGGENSRGCLSNGKGSGLCDTGSVLRGREILPVTEQECEYHCGLKQTVLGQESIPCSLSPTAAALAPVRQSSTCKSRPFAPHSRTEGKVSSSLGKGKVAAAAVSSDVLAVKGDHLLQDASCAENREPCQHVSALQYGLCRVGRAGVTCPGPCILSKRSTAAAPSATQSRPCVAEGPASPITPQSGNVLRTSVTHACTSETSVRSPHALIAPTAVISADVSKGGIPMIAAPMMHDFDPATLVSSETMDEGCCVRGKAVAPSVIRSEEDCRRQERKWALEKQNLHQVISVNQTKLAARELPADALDFSSTDSDCSDPCS